VKTKFTTDNGVACWNCKCTVCEYTVDDTVTYVSVNCVGCQQADTFYLPPAMFALDCAANVSAALPRSPFFLLTPSLPDTCKDCHDCKMAGYRPDMLTDPRTN
jgi:hypothetical protein